LGGLHVIGTERHEARRIDNQLRGRSGRQGDPGSSQFFLSLEDDLMRIFGGGRIKRLMERFDLPADVPIEAGMVSKAIAQAQSRVEGINFDIRKNLLEYDDVLNKQRLAFYSKRQRVLAALSSEGLDAVLGEAVENQFKRIEQNEAVLAELTKVLKEVGVPNPEEGISLDGARELFSERVGKLARSPELGRQLLGVMDFLWMNHLEDIEALTEAVRIRAYGQKDPIVEYRRESFNLFNAMMANFDGWVFSNLFRISEIPAGDSPKKVGLPAAALAKVGRNDPCPCGSGKKYKKCHGA